MGTIIDKTIQIAAPRGKVWDYVSNMENWSDFYVGLHSISDVDGSGDQAGSTYKAHFDLAGLTTLKFQGAIKEVDPAKKWRGETKGLLTSESVWEYEDNGEGGTTVTVRVDYTVAGSVLGKMADKLFIEKRNTADLEQTLKNLKDQLEN